MVGAPTASAATIAAARRRAMLQKEEEGMTGYTTQELETYEFKILRANTAAFRNPDTLRRVCAEEAQAGWSLIEKFDDYRLRFKRPISSRTLSNSSIDPYRTTYGGIGGSLVFFFIVCGMVGLVVLFGLLVGTG